MEMVLLSLMAETPGTGDVLGAAKTGQPGKPTPDSVNNQPWHCFYPRVRGGSPLNVLNSHGLSFLPLHLAH